MNDFLLFDTLLERKTHRKPQKSEEKHYLCVQQAFCNIHAEIPNTLYLIANIPQMS